MSDNDADNDAQNDDNQNNGNQNNGNQNNGNQNNGNQNNGNQNNGGDAEGASGAAGSAGGETRPARTRVQLTDISSRAWEHPADRGALTALRQLKGFDAVLKAVSGMWNERAVRLLFLGSAVRADDRQFPRVYRIFCEAAATLDIRTLPELYIRTDPMPNAMCIGLDKPFIVLNHSLIDMLDEEELRCVIGHELGHAMSGHAVYQTLLFWLLRLTGVIGWIPLGVIGIRLIIAALFEWWRKAELSGDRAGLLASQDPDAMLRTHMKLASGGKLEDVDTEAFLAQAAEYDKGEDLRDSILKLLLTEHRTHPFNVVRAAEIRHWVEGGEYARILTGDYPRRQDDDQAGMSEAAKAAADQYKADFARSQDPLTKIFSDVGGTLDGVRDKVAGFFGGNRGGRDTDRDETNGDTDTDTDTDTGGSGGR